MNQSFWLKKKVLITGHTGFKGGWLAMLLSHLGADIVGYALAPSTDPSLFELAGLSEKIHHVVGDIRDIDQLKNVFKEHKPEIVFHLAAQPLVRLSYDDPVETYSTNVMGTLNVLECIRHVGGVRSAIMVTSDKCYENKEHKIGYTEEDPMGGYDPYSSSKGCCELLVNSYRRSYFPVEQYQKHHLGLASARAGNVIGGGDWAKDRLVPDVMAAFIAHQPVMIRYPNSIRPWQHVLDPLSGYLELAEKLYEDGALFSGAWNFGPASDDEQTVEAVVSRLANLWGDDAIWKKEEKEQVHEAGYLKLNCEKANKHLQWMPKWNLDTALNMTVSWYQGWMNQDNLFDLSLSQIKSFLKET